MLALERLRIGEDRPGRNAGGQQRVDPVVLGGAGAKVFSSSSIQCRAVGQPQRDRREALVGQQLGAARSRCTASRQSFWLVAPITK